MITIRHAQRTLACSFLCALLGLSGTFSSPAWATTVSINSLSSPISNNTATITGYMSSGATLTAVVNTTASIGSVSYPTTTTWICTVSGLVTGENVVTVTAADSSENMAFASISLDSSIVGLWHMDGDWKDASGNNNNGTAYNGPTFSSTARVGSQSGSFDGSNDYVTIPSTVLLQPAQTLTVEAWVNPTNVSTWHQVVTKRYSEASAPYNSFILTTNNGGSDNKWRFCVSTASTQTCLNDTDVLVTNTWTHLVGTYDGTEMKFYVNSELKASTAKTGAINYSTLPLRIAAAVTAGPFFKGLIDEVAVYSRMLTNEEINKQYNDGLGRIARWRMNGDWKDATGKNHHGTAQNGAAFSDDAREGTQAGSFDRIDDLVTGDASGFPYSSKPRTLSAWIKTANATQERSILIYGNGGASDVQLFLDADNKAAVGIGSEIVAGTSLLGDSRWHHLAAVYEGSETNVVMLYVDGIAENTAIVTSMSTTAISFSLGASLTGESNFTGLLDDIALYDRAFTQDEITKLNSEGLGLVGLWHMDGDWKDASGNNNNGTAYNGPTFSSTARVGSQSGSFDGVNDYVSIPNSSTLNPADQITVSAWYKPQSFSGSGTDPIIDKAYSSHVSPYYQYHLGVTGDMYTSSPAKFIFNVTASGVTYSVSTPQGFWTPGYWYHIVGTYDGTTVKLHVNGELVSSVSASGQMVNYGSAVYIGRFKNLTKYLPGLIDEVAIYNRALTTGEILDRYNDALPLVSIISPAPGRTNNQTPLLNYSVSAGAVTVKVDGGIVSKASGSNLDLLSDGTHTVRVEAVNSSGNTGYAEAAFTVDTVPPAVSIAPVMSPTRFSSQTIMGTRELDSTVTVSINTSALVGPVTYPTPETWNCPITNIPNTTNIISASARDVAGNDGFAQETFIADADLPSIAIDPVTTLITNNTATITGTMENNATVTIALDTLASIGPITYPTPTTWSSIITSLATGTTFVTATATNAQGNTATATATIHNNLLGLWHMDGNWTDASGHGNYVGVNGATFSSYARVGSQAGKFDGQYDSVRVKNSALIGYSQQSTIEAWVNPSSFANSPRIYAESYGLQNGLTELFGLYLNTSGHVGFRLWRSDVSLNWVGIESNAALQLNSWSHVAATLDATGMKIYVNGVLSGINEANALPSDNTNIKYSQIGNIFKYLTCCGDGTNFFSGSLDEVAVYNRALEESEISAHYVGGLARASLWHMDGDWTDASGNGNDGTPNASAVFVPEARGGSQSGGFNGLDSAVTGTASSLPLGDTPRTIAAWVKVDSGTQSRGILQYGAHLNGKFELSIDELNRVVMGSDDSSITGASSLADGQWHYVSGVYEGSGTNIARIYVDGLQENSGAIVPPDTASGNFAVGAFLSGAGYLNGLIDELEIYSRALPVDEINKTYSDGLGRIGMWHMDGSWDDVSGNNNNGTAKNGVTFTANARVGIQAGSFDGTNDYLNVPYYSLNPLFNLDTRLTYELWVKPLTKGPLIERQQCQNASPSAELSLTGTAPNFDLTFKLHSSNSIGDSSFTAPAAVPYDAWTHIVATYDKDSQSVNIYVNGNNVLSQSYAQTLWKPTTPLWIGGILKPNPSCWDGYLKGTIDEAAVYNRALSAEEVAGRYNAIVVSAPTVTILSPASGMINTNAPQLLYSVSDGNVMIKVDGQFVFKVSGDYLDILSDGTHTVQVEGVGSNGKIGMARTTFTVDTVPPTIGINPVTSPTSMTSQTITGTVNGASAVSVFVSSPAVAGQVTYPTSTTWSCTVTNLAWGVNGITATTTDPAGNSATAATTINQYSVGIFNVGVNSNVLDVSTSNLISVYFTIDHPAAVTLKIIPEKQGPTGTPVYQASQDCSAAGAYSFTWDGKKSDGQIVPDEAYLYILEAENDGITTGRYSPEAATGGKQPVNVVIEENADQCGNVSMNIYCSLPTAARVIIQSGSFYDLSNLTSAYDYHINATGYYIVRDMPMDFGNHTFTWTGRDGQGKIMYRAGMNLPPIYAEATPLGENHIIITSSDTLKINHVAVDPCEIQLSYGAFAKIKYNLSADADVTISLISPTGASTTIVNSQPQTAGSKEYIWNGLDPSDPTGKKFLVKTEGIYTVQIQATDPASGKNNVAWGSLQLGY